MCLPWIVINPQLKRKLLANHPWVCLKVGGIPVYLDSEGNNFWHPKTRESRFVLFDHCRGETLSMHLFHIFHFLCQGKSSCDTSIIPRANPMVSFPTLTHPALLSTNPVNCAFAATGIASSLSWIFHTCWLKIICIPAICTVIHSRTSLQSSNKKRMVECLICFSVCNILTSRSSRS